MARASHELISLDEAWARMAQTLADVPESGAAELVPTELALGRVLAEPLISAVDVPPVDNSAMDGYALRAPANPDGLAGRSIAVSQRIAAGNVPEPLALETCARIFTGAPVPQGADSVVMQEHTQPGLAEGSVQFLQPVRPGQNIRRKGEDIALGQVVLHPGTRLGPAALGVAASIGLAGLPVRSRPRLGILTTGDELVSPGQPLPPGRIYNSNRHTLWGLGVAAGADVCDLGLVPDQLAATQERLREAAERCDLVISSGGVSVGEEDHLRQAVESVGGLDFWALAIKPGKPFVFGWLRRGDGTRALYMGLPGNPVASYVTFLLLVRPVLGVLSGLGWALPRSTWMTAAFDWPRPDKRREFLRARLDAQGEVVIHSHQGSGVLTSAAWAEGLVDVAPGTVIASGDRVRWLPLAELLQPAIQERQP